MLPQWDLGILGVQCLVERDQVRPCKTTVKRAVKVTVAVTMFGLFPMSRQRIKHGDVVAQHRHVQTVVAVGRVLVGHVGPLLQQIRHHFQLVGGRGKTQRQFTVVAWFARGKESARRVLVHAVRKGLHQGFGQCDVLIDDGDVQTILTFVNGPRVHVTAPLRIPGNDFVSDGQRTWLMVHQASPMERCGTDRVSFLQSFVRVVLAV